MNERKRLSCKEIFMCFSDSTFISPTSEFFSEILKPRAVESKKNWNYNNFFCTSNFHKVNIRLEGNFVIADFIKTGWIQGEGHMVWWNFPLKYKKFA